MFLKKLGLVLFCTGSMGLTACSGESWVKNIDLGTQEQNGEEYVQVSADINTRALQMASITIPIYDPKHAGVLIGQLSLVGGLGTGTSTLSVLVKSSALLTLPAGGAALPNGTAIPVSGVAANKWIAIPIGNGNSKVYFNLDLANKKAVFGTSLNIDALKVGVVANALLPFTVDKLSGLAGIYTGANNGQSGFALFVDASTLVADTVSANAVSFAQKASSSDAVKVQNKILELESKRTLLKAR